MNNSLPAESSGNSLGIFEIIYQKPLVTQNIRGPGSILCI